MDLGIVGLIIIGVFGLGFGLYLMREKKDNSKASPQNANSNANANPGATKSIVNKGAKEHSVPRKDMFKFMEFDKITDDMIVHENGSRYSVVVQCKGINYDLMSDVEQVAVEDGFITFLNTLKFPIQLYVQARAINLKTNIDLYKKSLNDINMSYNESAEKYSKMANSMNVQKNDLSEALKNKTKYENMLDYAKDITKYVEKISLNKQMLQRKFYVIISYYKSELGSNAGFTKEEVVDLCQRELFTRAQSVMSALQSSSVSSRLLNSNEIAELLYISYNRDDEKIIDIQSALESGFYRLYSTSKDVYEKKQEILDKEIKEEAYRRVKEAVLLTMDSNDIKTDEEIVEEFENRVDLEAIDILNDSNVDEKIKEEASKIIAENHIENKNKRKQGRKNIASIENINAEDNNQNNTSNVTNNGENNQSVSIENDSIV